MARKVSCLLTIAVAVLCMVTVSYAVGETKEDRDKEKVAIVNGVPIDKGEFDGEVVLIQRTVLGLGKPISCEQATSIQKEVLESMIRRELLYQAARKSGIKPDENTINQDINSLKQQFSSEAEYKTELSKRGINETVLRDRMIRNNLIQKYVDKEFGGKVTVADKQIQDYYQKNIDLFKQPFQMRISHIFIQTDPKGGDSRRKNLRSKAEKVLRNLKNDLDFADLAREDSDGPTKNNGGDLGYLRKGQLEKQFESKVLALKKGEITDIIETEYGFHIFKVTDIKPETILAYENVKEKVKKFLVDEKAKKEADEYARKLREKSDVKILLPELTRSKR